MKKESYFTPATIQTKTEELLAFTSISRRAHDEVHLRPERAALFVLDMQEYFISERSHAFVPSATAIIPGIQALIHAFVINNRPVIFTRHSNNTDNAHLMALWWRAFIKAETPESEIISEFDTTQGIVIDKHQYDAFYDTELEKILHDNGVGEVVITGVMTHLCCETTARSAFMRGFEVLFVVDGTATYGEAFHRATILNLSHGFATPVQVNDVLIHVK